jgi:hypothetical protein
LIGKRSAQMDLFGVGNVYPVKPDPGGFHGQLATVAERLFADDMLASFTAPRWVFHPRSAEDRRAREKPIQV